MSRMMPVDGTLTAGFDQPRPLTANVKTHVHGAQDIAAKAGTPIVAPEAGKAFAFVALRPDKATRWIDTFEVNGEWYEFGNYFYDTFGGCVVLRSDTGLTHIITHSWINQLINLKPFAGLTMFTKEASAGPWPIAMWSEPLWVQCGEQIGTVGNAGMSTGPHVHWEIHRGNGWEPHVKRIDPLKWAREEV